MLNNFLPVILKLFAFPVNNGLLLISRYTVDLAHRGTKEKEIRKTGQVSKSALLLRCIYKFNKCSMIRPFVALQASVSYPMSTRTPIQLHETLLEEVLLILCSDLTGDAELHSLDTISGTPHVT